MPSYKYLRFYSILEMLFLVLRMFIASGWLLPDNPSDSQLRYFRNGLSFERRLVC